MSTPLKTLPAQMTGKIKLKDKLDRNFFKFNIKELFGFVPEEMMIKKVTGEANAFVIYALHTEESLKAQLAKEKENEKNTVKADRKKRQRVAKREEEKA